MTRNGSRRLANERAELAAGVPVCRTCGEAKNATEFFRHHAVCIPCCRKRQVAYRHRTRTAYMRERRMAMLRKYMDGCIVEGECPICGVHNDHNEECTLLALRRSIVQLGWEKQA